MAAALVLFLFGEKCVSSVPVVMLLLNMLASVGDLISLATLREKILLWPKLVTVISDTILAKLPTVWENTTLSTGSTIARSTTKSLSINTKEHSRWLHVNSFVWFMDCWPKTNCTPAYRWIHQLNKPFLAWFSLGLLRLPFFRKNISKSFQNISWHITRLLNLYDNISIPQKQYFIHFGE